MKLFLLSVAWLALAVVAWDMTPGHESLKAAAEPAPVATAIDFDALNAEARGAMERLQHMNLAQVAVR